MAEMKNLTINGTQFTLPFAPAGYGLGGSSVLKNTETWNGCGFFRLETGTPDNGQIFGYQVDLYGNGVYRELYGTYIANTHRSRLHRTDINGVAGPWEWENPPMLLGVEYRTTERWNGMPVYTQLFNAGLMVDGKQVEIPHLTASGIIVRKHETFNNGIPLPWFYSYGNKNIKVEYNKSSSENKFFAVFDSHADIGANYTVYIQLWYAK